jgi:DMSO/TMAO reductase YedYZ molybdopterin-dependent catalytic subunit
MCCHIHEGFAVSDQNTTSTRSDAFHPQTILAYGMNGGVLPIGHGAPLRLRVERQLGHKHAKFILRVEAVESLAGIGGGRGGFWEDAGDYYWYAGI